MASYHILGQGSGYVKIQPHQSTCENSSAITFIGRNERSSTIWFVQSSVGLLVIIVYTVQSVTDVMIFQFHRNDTFRGFIIHIIAKFLKINVGSL